jgi:hypothetical protein
MTGLIAVCSPDFVELRRDHRSAPGIIRAGRENYIAGERIGEVVEGFVIKWFLLAGMLGFVVCAFMVA